MATVEDLDAVIERCQQAMREFGKGNPKHMQALYSHRDDVTIATAIDPPARGWEEVALRMERSASNLREGEIGRRDRRLRDREQGRHPGARLRRVGGASQGQGRRGGRDRGFPLEGHDNLPCGGRHLEDRPPARGHGDHAPPA
jgi:hypothetical protein